MLFKKKTKIPEPPNSEFPEVRSMKETAKPIDLFDWNVKKPMESTRPSFEDLPHELPKENIKEIPETSEFETTDFNRFAERREKKDKQIFIKIDNFKEIVASLENISNKLQELDEIVSKLQELASEESSEVEAWKSDIDNIKEEIRTIGSNLSE
jgi:chromosome segregation ATPase